MRGICWVPSPTPITNVRSDILSPHDGRVLGMALNQVVLPGFAAYRIGIKSSQEEMSELPQDDDTTPTDTSGVEPEVDPELVDEEEDEDLAIYEYDEFLEASE